MEAVRQDIFLLATRVLFVFTIRFQMEAAQADIVILLLLLLLVMVVPSVNLMLTSLQPIQRLNFQADTVQLDIIMFPCLHVSGIVSLTNNNTCNNTW